jgi:hypothetical protein
MMNEDEVLIGCIGFTIGVIATVIVAMITMIISGVI